MIENELISVRAVIHNNDNKILLGLAASGPEAGSWVLFGEKSKPGEPFEQEIVKSVHDQTGLEFSPVGQFMTTVDSVSVPGHKRNVIVYDGPAKGEPKPSIEFANIHPFSREEINDPNLPMTKNARIILTTWFAYHNGV